jgi:AraC family transcriptional regulator, 4-hydroxyphenylacetate 3-monooxygenase operon regulatory protein
MQRCPFPVYGRRIRHEKPRSVTRATDIAAIPNVVMDRVHDRTPANVLVHYGTLGSLADFFGRDRAAHRHDHFFQLHFIEAGDLSLKLDGVAFEAVGPVVFFTPPSVPHAFRIDPQATGHVLTIHQSIVRQIFDTDPSLPRASLAASCCLPLEGSEGRHEARNLSRLFGILRREMETRRPGEDSAVNALSCLILVALFRLSRTPAEAAMPRQHDLRLLRKFNDLVEQNFTRHWTISDYIAALNVTETRLHDLCRKIAGRSPKKIAHERLLLEARRLLGFSNFSINEIAGALGFEDVGYFCRFFKRELGVTPSAYRAQLTHEGGRCAKTGTATAGPRP